MEYEEYREKIKAWRQKMDDALRAEDSWLALAGLFWLSEGSNRMGTDSSSIILLPKRNLPRHVADIVLEGDEVSLLIRSEAPLAVDGQVVQRAKLVPDIAGSPTEIKLGELTMILINRGDRFAIRLWDNQRTQRVEFGGRKWYPIQESYRLNAQFIAYQPVKIMIFPNELGEVEENEVVGYIPFTMGGKECRLDVVEVAENRLLIMFKDLTSSVQTYPPGRYLVMEAPINDGVVLDFNRAYNPPCAFTKYATCTFPPPQNHLPVPVEAGERYG